MKRDLDLARRLLLEIESRGIDCSLSILRAGSDHDDQERVRYHLRLLIDAGLLKEVDRTSSGIPCVRLTHDGHELLELARNQQRWNEAKQICFDRLGGLSLTILRGILLRWATGTHRPRRRYVSQRLRYEPEPLLEHVNDRRQYLDDLNYVGTHHESHSDDVVDLEFDIPLPTDLI